MLWRSAIGQTWERWSGAVKRELLREPERILIDCGPDALPLREQNPPQPETSREMSLERA
ncbi:hypothetical protein [Sphingobium sp. Sx8-8]|uniref:hypothetical protein n=1 Tax=Sphingobium sp. Sx8-8 TaxID=2933617 RepID=UPI001F5AB974|nr:hypothetical protein [Sphingobium sp. Sx8-8]